MQHEPKGGRVSLRIDTLEAALDQGIENEAGALEALVSAAAKGQPHPELWAKLHQATARNDRFSELAFAYERLTGDRRVTTLPAAIQADVLMHAATFFADVFGDAVGARGHLERVVTLAPGRVDAFERLERLLKASNEAIKLAELYANAASHRSERAEQVDLLHRAVALLEGLPGEEERFVKLLQQLLKIAPGDATAREALEAVYVGKGKLADVAKMLEQALLADPPPSDVDAIAIRARLVELYAGQLKEVDRSLPHVEDLLGRDAPEAAEVAAAALPVAEALLARKAVAVRAAAALEGAYLRDGRVADAARMMNLQIEGLRGPRRTDVQKRLADLLFQKIGDLAGAITLYEGIVAVDPSDDELRGRYLTLVAALDKRLDAVRILGRAGTAARDKAVRARIGVEIGELHVELGDARKARGSFQQVIDGGADEGASLRAARGLAKLCEKEKDARGLAAALARLADAEPELAARVEAAERLGRLCEGELSDTSGAITAYRKLLDSAREPTALAALERLYEATGDHAELAGVLERRADAEPDNAAARDLALRAAELRSTKLTDRSAAIAAWRRFVTAFGASRDAHARLLPLLEQERRWEELAETLAADATLASGAERAATLARLGAIRAARLQDLDGALAAYREALALDPAERTSRLAVEKMLGGAAQGQRLAACAVLEPIARDEGAAALLLRVLETKADLLGAPTAPAGEATPAEQPRPSAHDAVTVQPPSYADPEPGWSAPPPPPATPRGAAEAAPQPAAPRVAERLTALAEAVGLAERELKDPKKAIELATRGIHLATEAAPEDVAQWIAEVERLTEHSGDAARRAASLAGALGSRHIDSAALSHLARRAGEALVANGDVAEALALYRRALAFEPSSPELIARVDALLREQGSPEERIALYREALEQPCTLARRREILHAIGAIQRRDLGDLAAAAATYRAALEHDPDDAAAYEALLEAYAAAGAWDALYEALAERLPRVAPEALTAHELRMADVAARSASTPRAMAHYHAILSRGVPLEDAALVAMEALARGAGHPGSAAGFSAWGPGCQPAEPALLREVFERRVATAVEPQEEAVWLEQLGDLAAGGLGQATEGDEPARDVVAAVAAWRRAALLAEGPLADPERAQRLFERVLESAPNHREAAARLLALYREQGAWARLPAVCEVLLDTAASDDEALAELCVLEDATIRAHAQGASRGEAEAVSGGDNPIDRFVAAAARLQERLQRGERGAERAAARERAVSASLARVLAADPARQDHAAAIHRQLVERPTDDAGDAAAMDAFRTFLAASPDTPARREDRRWLFSLLAERAPEEERTRALLSWASWEEAEVGDRAAAAALYARVIEADPEHDDALAARARLLMDVGDYEGAAEVLAARRERSEGSARAALDVELATLLLDRLDRPADALAAIAPALEGPALDPAAINVVQSTLSRPETRADAAELIERAVDGVEDAEARIALLEMLLTACPAAVDDAEAAGEDARAAAAATREEARRRWFERLLEHHEDTPEVALDVALRVVAERPADLEMWDRVEALERRAKQPDRVAAAYAAALDAAGGAEGGAPLSPEDIEELGRRAVEHHEEWFDAPEAAVKLLRRLVELAPGSTWGFERLKLAYNAAERWDDLFTLYDAMLARTEDRDERIFLLEDAANVARDLAADADRTMTYLEALLSLQDDARTRTTLERLYERHGKHEPLIRLLQTELPRLPADAAQALRQRIALLWIDGVTDAASALPIAEEMLQAEPGSEDAFGLLERVVGALPPSAEGPPTARQRAAELLEARYRSEERPAELVRVLEIQLETAAGDARPTLLGEVVRLRRDVLGDEAGALDRLAELCVLDPTAAERRAELLELAEHLGRYDRLAAVLAEAATRAEPASPSLAITLRNEAAALHRDRLDDANGAIALLRRTYALADQHGDAAAALAAARDLDRLFAAGDRAAERCDVLDLLAALEPEPAARRWALGELARLSASALGDDARAIAAYKARLADDAVDLEALDGLAAILEQGRRFRELTDVLDRRAAARGGDDARRDLSRVARLFDEEIGDAAQAIATWLRIRAELGPDPESGEALAALYARTDRRGDLMALLDEEARSAADAGDVARSADLWRRLGDVHRDRTSEWERAVESYQRAYDAEGAAGAAAAAPRPSRGGLEELLRRVDLGAEAHRGALVAVVGALRDICVAADDWAGQVALLEPRLAAAGEEAERVSILRASSALLEERGGDVGGAFELAWRGFLLAPGTERPTDLLRLAAAARRWQKIAAALPELEDRGDVHPATLRDLWWHVAAWQREDREDLDAAEHAFERALAHAPSSAAILLELAELQRQRRGPALVGTLLRLAEATGGDLDLYREAVETARDAAHDAPHARKIAGKMLELAARRWTESDAPGDAVALSPPAHAALWAIDALSAMLLEAGDKPEVVALCRRGAALGFPPAEQRRLRRVAAEAADLELSIALYTDLFEEDPSDEPVGEALAALLRGDGRREALVRIREQQIAVCQDAARRVALRFDAALLLADLGDATAAIDALRKSLAEAPEHAASAERLAALLEAGGLHADLTALREEQAAAREAAGDAAAAAALWLAAASLSEGELRDIPRAIADHRRAAALGAGPALDALARLLSARGEHAAAAEALEKLCEGATPEALCADTLRLADVYVADGRPERARASLERALAALSSAGAGDAVAAEPAGDAGDPAAGGEAVDPTPLRERLAGLYRDAGLWVALAELTAGDAARTGDPAARLTLLREAAELHLLRGDSPAAAIPLLDEAISMSPDDLSLRLSRCRALGAAGRAEDATTALRAMIAGFGARRPKERALVHYELARISLTTGDRARAMAELDLALRIDPAHPEALHALAGLALEEGQLDRAHRAYRALLLVARRQRDPAESLFSRAEILLALAEIAHRQGEPDREAEHVESAFEAARESDVEHARLLGALRARARHDLLARALEAQLEGAAQEGAAAAPLVPAAAAALLDELAGLYEGPLARPDAALDARLRALDLTPRAAAAHAAALDLARRMGQLERYVALLDRLLEQSAGAPGEVDLLLHLAHALELSSEGGDAGTPDADADARAADVYRRAEPLLAGAGDPRLDAVWRAQEALYGRLGDRAAQVEVLQKRVDAADNAAASGASVAPDDRADPRYRLATLCAGDAGTLGRTISLLEQALELHPDPDRAEAILRDALRVDPTSVRAARLFERIARDNDKKRSLVDALVFLAGVEDGPGFLEEAVAVARALGDRELAESILRRVVAFDGPDAQAPDPPGAAWALVAFADLREEVGDLAAAASLRERAARISPPDEERALLLRVASLAAGSLDDLACAARIYEELRAREPAEREVWAPLAEVYRRSGDAEHLSALLEQTIPLVDSIEERCALRLERARLLIRSDAEQATALLREILDEDPSQVEAAILLATMLEEAGRLEELGDLYALQLDAAKDRADVPSIVSLSMRLGALLEQRGDEDAALDVYHAAIDWDGASRDALRAVVRLNLKRDDSVDLTDSLDKLLAVEQGDDAVEIALQLSQMRAAHGDDAGAEAALATGYAACPASDRLREELAARYAASASWRKLAELYSLEADVRTEDDARVECLCRAAEILRQRAGDAGAAAETLERALRIAPADRDVLLALIDACGALGEHDRAKAAITATLDVSPEDPWLYRSRAALHEALGDGELALADLERAYALGGGAYATELVEQLERTLVRREEAGAGDAPSPSAAEDGDGALPAPLGPRGLRLRLADVLSTSGDFDRARAHLSDLLRKDGKDRDALRTLAAIEETSERWDAASAVYRRLIALEDGPALVATALRLSDACARGDRPGDARGGLERALRVAPDDVDVRERLRTLYNVTGASRELAAMTLEDAAAASDVAGRFALLLAAARLLIDAEDAPQAIVVLEEARALRPEEQEATLLLIDASAASGRGGDARALLCDLIASHKGRRSKALGAVYHRLARLEALEGKPRESLAALSKAFENDTQNGALAMELAGYALERGEHEIAARAFRAITLMKPAVDGGADGATPYARAVAYYHLGTMALALGDRRKARLMLDKSVSEDGSLEAARALLDELRAG